MYQCDCAKCCLNMSKRQRSFFTFSSFATPKESATLSSNLAARRGQSCSACNGRKSVPERVGGAAFDADETEFTLTVVVSALVNFDATQTYQLRFGCISHRVSAGTPATGTITAVPLSMI